MDPYLATSRKFLRSDNTLKDRIRLFTRTKRATKSIVFFLEADLDDVLTAWLTMACIMSEAASWRMSPGILIRAHIAGSSAKYATGLRE